MNKKLYSIIDAFYKFAEIPKYQKCKQCGQTDPYLGDEGLCYKCFDPNKPAKLQLDKSTKKSSSIENYKFVICEYDPANYIIWRLQLKNGLILRALALIHNTIFPSATIPKEIMDYKIVDIQIEATITSKNLFNKFLEAINNKELTSLKHFAEFSGIKNEYKKYFTDIPVKDLPDIIEEVSAL